MTERMHQWRPEFLDRARQVAVAAQWAGELVGDTYFVIPTIDHEKGEGRVYQAHGLPTHDAVQALDITLMVKTLRTETKEVSEKTFNMVGSMLYGDEQAEEVALAYILYNCAARNKLNSLYALEAMGRHFQDIVVQLEAPDIDKSRVE